MSACEHQRPVLLYCDVHDAYFCPIHDVWAEKACSDPECGFCPGRAQKPSVCEHPDSHYSHDENDG